MNSRSRRSNDPLAQKASGHSLTPRDELPCSGSATRSRSSPATRSRRNCRWGSPPPLLVCVSLIAGLVSHWRERAWQRHPLNAYAGSSHRTEASVLAESLAPQAIALFIKMPRLSSNKTQTGNRAPGFCDQSDASNANWMALHHRDQRYHSARTGSGFGLGQAPHESCGTGLQA